MVPARPPAVAVAPTGPNCVDGRVTPTFPVAKGCAKWAATRSRTSWVGRGRRVEHPVATRATTRTSAPPARARLTYRAIPVDPLPRPTAHPYGERHQGGRRARSLASNPAGAPVPHQPVAAAGRIAVV